MPFSYFLSVAGITIQLETDHALTVEDSFEPFLIGETEPDFLARFCCVKSLPQIPSEVLAEERCYRVHPDGEGSYLRSFFEKPEDPTPYAVAVRNDSNECIWVDYLKEGEHCLAEVHNCFSHMDFEAMLLHRQRICFHAACVQTSLGGLLFSGPSGIGKSTQAELWCQYRGARQINGDRPILSKGEGGWLAWGSPYAGSSRCHINESCPVTAIIMLRQAETCALRRLDTSEAFRAVWSGLTVHSWDGRFVETACDLAMELIHAIPVFELSCTPDEAAVDYLEQGLRKECGL